MPSEQERRIFEYVFWKQDDCANRVVGLWIVPLVFFAVRCFINFGSITYHMYDVKHSHIDDLMGSDTSFSETLIAVVAIAEAVGIFFTVLSAIYFASCLFSVCGNSEYKRWLAHGRHKSNPEKCEIHKFQYAHTVFSARELAYSLKQVTQRFVQCCSSELMTDCRLEWSPTSSSSGQSVSGTILECGN